MNRLMLAIRSTLFYLGYCLSVVWFSVTGVVFFSFAPYPLRNRYILNWNRFVIFWLRWTCRIHVQIVGQQNLPATPYVALSKHQSQWETYFLQYFLAPVCIVLKHELLRVPFFGWGLKLTDPIAIDRGSPKQALKQTLQQGKERLQDNKSVLIFPEGTRTHAGKIAKYARGGANIAVAAAVPVVPIAHNAGEFWPADKFLKYPGTITVVIGKPLSSQEQDSRQITEQCKEWIEKQVSELDKRSG